MQRARRARHRVLTAASTVDSNVDFPRLCYESELAWPLCLFAVSQLEQEDLRVCWTLEKRTSSAQRHRRQRWSQQCFTGGSCCEFASFPRAAFSWMSTTLIDCSANALLGSGLFQNLCWIQNRFGAKIGNGKKASMLGVPSPPIQHPSLSLHA